MLVSFEMASNDKYNKGPIEDLLINKVAGVSCHNAQP